MIVALVLLGTVSGYIVGLLVSWSTGRLLTGFEAGVATGVAVILFVGAARALSLAISARHKTRMAAANQTTHDPTLAPKRAR
ncbi:MAG: hypothetical protein GC186_12105 [Rhodobacteraceae bacterium]|nr:hypothetical protein [Paracoccaceae bacterium]